MKRSIFLIPAPDYRSRLLGPGVLPGSGPPIVRRECDKGWRGPWEPWSGGHTPLTWHPDSAALVLAWAGEVAPLGVSRVEAHGAWKGETASRLRQWLGGPEHCSHIVPPEMGAVVMSPLSRQWTARH